MPPKKGKAVDYDDDDGYDDDYYDDGYGDDYDDAPPPPKQQPKPAAKQQPKKQAAPAAPAAATKVNNEQKAPFRFNEPSPDDRVRQAQSGRAGGAAATGTPLGPPAVGECVSPPSLQSVTRDVHRLGMGESLGVEGSPAAPPASRAPPTSAFVQDPAILAELGSGSQGKAPIQLVVVGHVDAGKSTLMGHLLHLVDAVGKKVMHKHQRESAEQGKGSFAFAWVLDERPEERARGVTIDVASTHFETANRHVTLMDAPGHRDFVPNMICGAAQADAAVLVVDASVGGFEAGFEAASEGPHKGGGQTREHAQLAKSLGVENLIVAINKMDCVSYSEDRFKFIIDQLGPFLRSCGFKPNVLQWLPVSGFLGENITQAPSDAKLLAWYQGPTLMEAIDNLPIPSRPVDRPLRVTVSDVARSNKGGDIVVGGKVEAGAFRVGTKVLQVPGGEICTVRGIERHGTACTLASAGDAVDIMLAFTSSAAPDNSTGGVRKGDVFCDPSFPIRLVKVMQARIVVLGVKRPILKGATVVVHAHNSAEPAVVSKLLELLDPKTGETTKANPRCLIKGQTAVVELTLNQGMCLETYSDCRPLGRLVIRDQGMSIAVGIVTLVS